MMQTPLSVSSLNEQIKTVLETTLSSVYVEGEISNLTYHNSGHIYFSIKDDKSNISCVMFRGNAQYLKFRLELGAKVVVSGNITVYTPRGNYQLLCQKIEPSGVGALALAYEQLKTKLQIKGYFDKSVKKQLPKFPNEIYVVTSNTGAAIEDMKKVLTHRYPLAKMILIPTLVQGVGAKESIVKAIKLADKVAQSNDKLSLIIVGRGGGSIEDLWAFNEEIVADAIFEAITPIISAVGHESDFVISDFVADVRASTPSNAIEISTPDINELRIYVDTLFNDFNQKLKTIMYQKEQHLKHIKNSFEQYSLKKRFEFVQTTIVQLKQQFNSIYAQILKVKKDDILRLQNSFLLNSPEKKDKKGFVQVTKENKIVDINTLKVNEIISLESSKCLLQCEVISKKVINTLREK
jgi:exodeoxyribonuclease VII large subunit